MSSIPDQKVFENAYAGQAPWDIGKPQPALVRIADRVVGSIFDAGCGTGDNALFFAQRGHPVTGVDYIEEPIRRAKQKAADKGINATFVVMDARSLHSLSQRFDNVIDCGLFHVFSDDDRKRYVDGLATILRPGGRVWLICFSDEEPGTQGPRRISKKQLFDAFANNWSIESIEPVRFEVIPNLKDLSFSPGGPKAWFTVIRRTGKPLPFIETIVETAIYADDLAQAETFYTTVLGLTCIGKQKDRQVFFQVGSSSMLLIFKPDTTLKDCDFPSHGCRGPGHFALGIKRESLDAWRQHLSECRVAIEKEITWPLGGQSLYFRDPAGNAVELITPGVWGTPSGW